MTPQTLTLSMAVVPPVAKRQRHVLILPRTARGHFILGRKQLYPAGISRMLGGGLEGNEQAQVGAVRELAEETGFQARADQLQPLATVIAQLTERSSGQYYRFETEIFLIRLPVDVSLKAGDDVDALVELSEPELRGLIQRYQELSPELDPDKGFAWYDYGQLYGPIHQIALDRSTQVE